MPGRLHSLAGGVDGRAVWTVGRPLGLGVAPLAQGPAALGAQAEHQVLPHELAEALLARQFPRRLARAREASEPLLQLLLLRIWARLRALGALEQAPDSGHALQVLRLGAGDPGLCRGGRAQWPGVPRHGRSARSPDGPVGALALALADTRLQEKRKGRTAASLVGQDPSHSERWGSCTPIGTHWALGTQRVRSALSQPGIPCLRTRAIARRLWRWLSR